MIQSSLLSVAQQECYDQQLHGSHARHELCPLHTGMHAMQALGLNLPQQTCSLRLHTCTQLKSTHICGLWLIDSMSMQIPRVPTCSGSVEPKLRVLLPGSYQDPVILADKVHLIRGMTGQQPHNEHCLHSPDWVAECLKELKLVVIQQCLQICRAYNIHQYQSASRSCPRNALCNLSNLMNRYVYTFTMPSKIVRLA